MQASARKKSQRGVSLSRRHAPSQQPADDGRNPVHERRVIIPMRGDGRAARSRAGARRMSAELSGWSSWRLCLDDGLKRKLFRARSRLRGDHPLISPKPVLDNFRFADDPTTGWAASIPLPQ